MRDALRPIASTRGILATFGVLSTLAGGVIAAELAAPRLSLAPPATAPIPPAPAPTIHVRPAAAADAELRFILSRPLFTSGRRPPPEAADRRNALPRLAGIVTTPFSTTAIFAGEQAGQRGAILPAGASIEGWTLLRITAHKVWLRRENQELGLQPSYGARPDAPPLSRPSLDLRQLQVLGAKHVNPQLAW